MQLDHGMSEWAAVQSEEHRADRTLACDGMLVGFPDRLDDRQVRSGGSRIPRAHRSLQLLIVAGLGAMFGRRQPQAGRSGRGLYRELRTAELPGRPGGSAKRRRQLGFAEDRAVAGAAVEAQARDGASNMVWIISA